MGEYMMAACVEHWLDGKDHSRLQDDASTNANLVQHLRIIVKYVAYAIAALSGNLDRAFDKTVLIVFTSLTIQMGTYSI